MKGTVFSAVVVAGLFLAASSFITVEAASLSSSLGLAPYPTKGQTPDQQNKDEGECYAWAKQQTGIDPMAAASAPPQQSGKSGGGERVRGAARGAAGGAAIGAIAGDAGKGAAAGAVVGTMAGGHQKRKNQREAEQQAQQQQANSVQSFNKAFGACMEGRGYSVK